MRPVAPAEAPGQVCDTIDASGTFPDGKSYSDLVGFRALLNAKKDDFRKALVEDWLRGAQWSSNALPRWVSHPTYDDYWRERDASRDYTKANAPALHIGGYWDIFGQAPVNVA